LLIIFSVFKVKKSIYCAKIGESFELEKYFYCFFLGVQKFRSSRSSDDSAACIIAKVSGVQTIVLLALLQSIV